LRAWPAVLITVDEGTGHANAAQQHFLGQIRGVVPIRHKVCKREVGSLFVQRWNVELDLRNVKDTLGLATLSCKTPEMCEKELWVYVLAYNRRLCEC
jgi:hypothetical protein